MRDLNSRVTEEHSRARVRDRHQLVDCDRLLGASQSAGSPRDWNTKRSKMSKTKMSQRFFPGEKRKKGVFFFSQAPCISQAPFHAPIRGGYQGGARLSKMDCSDTTQSLQVSLEGQFKKSFLGLSPSIQEVGKLFLVSPQNTSS